MEKDVSAHPGYVRLALRCDDVGALRACRLFAELCREESAQRALILARSSGANGGKLESQVALAAGGLAPGFKLALVAAGSDAALIARAVSSTAGRLSGKAAAFRSEHHAAAWLMAA
jgi:hypothetical protein